MEWYEKLNKYFPEEEMKSKEHVECLLDEKGEVYHKDESENHVLLYAEFDAFIFIDYLWVSSESRGQGIGRKLIQKLKKKNKPIILEVEPIDYDDSDTEKRMRFYNREEFQHAQSIIYKNRSYQTDTESHLEILYWSPGNESELFIYEQMKTIYEKIHAYKGNEIYGKDLGTVEEALTFKEKVTNE
jgi:GNAT superfamily N-acetyltransferase